jgi:hypothetical protein
MTKNLIIPYTYSIKKEQIEINLFWAWQSIFLGKPKKSEPAGPMKR